MTEVINNVARKDISNLRDELNDFKDDVKDDIKEIKVDIKNHLSAVNKKIDRIVFGIIALMASIITTFIAVIIK